MTTSTFPWAVSTTQVYTHVNPAALQAKIQGEERIAVLEKQLAAISTELAELKQAAMAE